MYINVFVQQLFRGRFYSSKPEYKVKRFRFLGSSSVHTRKDTDGDYDSQNLKTDNIFCDILLFIKKKHCVYELSII